MEVNTILGVLSNCTDQSESNCTSVLFYECMDSYASTCLSASSVLVNAALMLPLNCWILRLATAGVASPDIVILNQAVAEVFGNCCLIFFLFGILFNNKVLVLIFSFFGSTFIIGRPLFQTFFCVERYLAVVHPLVYLKYTKAPKLKVPIVGLIWLIIFGLAWFIVDSYPKIPILLYTGLFLVLLLVCITCSVMILWVLKRPKPGDGERGGAYQLKRKAFISVTVILITLVFGYGTVAGVFSLRDQIPYYTYCIMLGLSWWTLLPSGAVQPYLYLSKLNKLPCIKNI